MADVLLPLFVDTVTVWLPALAAMLHVTAVG
jgi:hypothetical protein